METQIQSQPKSPAAHRRVPNWPATLNAFIDENRARSFCYGEHDCCLFASNGVRALTGLDPAAKVFRGKYRDATGAMRLVRKHGGIEAIAARQCEELGFAEVAVGLAQRGDVVLRDVDSPMKCAMGICCGKMSAFPSTDGLQFLPTAECRRAWRVA